MDDKLREAVEKQLQVSEFVTQFNKSFRKVFGITPTMDSVDELSRTVEAHDELWALDGRDWLLVQQGAGDEGWVIATPEVFADTIKETP